MRSFFKTIIFVVSAILLFPFFSQANNSVDRPVLIESEAASPSLSSSEIKARKAAVKIITESGHGSGTYVLFNEFHIILTASHVVTNRNEIIVVNEEESITGILVYNNQVADIAALLVEPMETREPIRYRPFDGVPPIGRRVFYSGYPADHNLLTIRGLVSGYKEETRHGDVIIVHGYAWLGCSGAGVYDGLGRLVGILWAVDNLFFASPQLVEDIIWISPASNIDKELLMEGICSNRAELSRCRKYDE